jgi:hypothetical protein
VDNTRQLDAPDVSTAMLWWGLLVGPAAWALDQGISYSIDQHACSTGRYYLLHAITAGCFLLALTGVVAGWRQLARVPGANEDGGSPRDRSWFMARLGIFMSLGFALVILGLAVPKIVLSPCD